MRVRVLYASQTGTAAAVAQRVNREAWSRGAESSSVRSVDDVDLLAALRDGGEMAASVTVLVVATTGQGDVPDALRPAWRALLQRSLAASALAGVSFALVGVGDSGYAEFNYAAKKVHRRLLQLGAVPLVPPVWCDEQHPYGLEGDLDPWLDALWAALGLASVASPTLEPIYLLTAADTVSRSEDDAMAATASPPTAAAPATRGHPFLATVTSNERLTATDHFQDVRHIVFDISSSGIRFDSALAGCLLLIFFLFLFLLQLPAR